jgi:hypothetical protein
MDPKQNTRKLANAWITHPRQSGQPQHNLRHSCLKALTTIGKIDSSDPSTPIKKWTENVVELPQDQWHSDMKKPMQKWSAENSAAEKK